MSVSRCHRNPVRRRSTRPGCGVAMQGFLDLGVAEAEVSWPRGGGQVAGEAEVSQAGDGDDLLGQRAQGLFGLGLDVGGGVDASGVVAAAALGS
ncbi:hypothetical protein [Actinacidiphila oryziradicis]|uniref:Uncharacterized protein n=1 Tax=Actinacidiphila oryziradicis TaxID=2571141 RepID=A0A4U0SC50_9ACTN|nr:hypothetical protein [Actinacidiphila oryziradicis]TKA06363.1 hypothetical protein FCI23_31740 [Actinacidiphila oryziradicis]